MNSAPTSDEGEYLRLLPIVDTISALGIPTTSTAWEKGLIPWRFPSLALVRDCIASNKISGLVLLLPVYQMRASNESERYQRLYEEANLTDEQIEMALFEIDRNAHIEGDAYIEGANKVSYSGITRDELIEYERQQLFARRGESEEYNNISKAYHYYSEALLRNGIIEAGLHSGKLRVSQIDFGEWLDKTSLAPFDPMRARRMAVDLLCNDSGKPFTMQTAGAGDRKYQRLKREREVRREIEDDLVRQLDALYLEWMSRR